MVAVSSSARSGMHRREFEEKDKKRGRGGGRWRRGETAEGGKQGKNKANGRIASQEKE